MIELSALNKTWIIDVDGTIVKHNGYKIDGFDTLLDGVEDFFKNLDEKDKVILLTARENKELYELKKFLQKNKIRYDYIIADIPVGERIIINDIKPSGLKTAYSINKKRNEEFCIEYKINKDL